MEVCVMCRRTVEPTENWLKARLWGGFAIFHWSCFGEFLRSGCEEQVERGLESEQSGENELNCLIGAS
jgi:hypothetical protein